MDRNLNTRKPQTKISRSKCHRTRPIPQLDHLKKVDSNDKLWDEDIKIYRIFFWALENDALEKSCWIIYGIPSWGALLWMVYKLCFYERVLARMMFIHFFPYCVIKLMLSASVHKTSIFHSHLMHICNLLKFCP